MDCGVGNNWNRSLCSKNRSECCGTESWTVEWVITGIDLCVLRIDQSVVGLNRGLWGG